jgi:peptidoglycan/xylan/chitin deacetylase (PgdA/CDA1 family)
MRTIITKTFIAAAALCSAHAVAIAQDAPMGPTQNGPPPAAEAPAAAAPAAAVPQPQMGPSAPAAKATDCPGNPNPLGVARVVEIDTTGGPGFGFQHYKMYDFLNPKEVVLTFDDGPLPNRTTAVLAALNAECTKAIFFSVGKVAAGYPDILHEVAKAGHTIGAHTMDHKDLSKLPFDDAKADIEKSFSVIHRAVGSGTAPFFRFPFLRHSPETLKYLADRNVAVFSTDIDSFDFKGGKADALVKRIMANLDKRGKGIILMHDIQPHTAAAMPALLKQLKAGGYKVVQMTAKTPIQTLPEYDEMVAKDMQGMPTALSDRPLNSVVKTISGQ